MTAHDHDWLRARAAARAESKPFFVASALATYRELTEMDDAGLAAMLGCSPAALHHLALCRRPEGEGAMFRQNVQQIAAHTGCDAGRLAQVLRAAAAADAMRGAAPASLLAARDRISEDSAAYDAQPEREHAADHQEPPR